jgi:DNA-binding transcriptional regulator YdaS (Cro superfamily)
MNALKKFIDNLPRGERRQFREKLAEKLGVSEVMVRHMANGIRSITAEHAPEIERLTGIKAECLCPSVDWTYIRGTAKTPMPKEAAA